MEKEFYSRQDLAKRFNVTVYTIDNWVKGGKLKAIKVSGTVRFTEAAVQEMLAASVQQPTGLSPEARDAIAALVKAAPTLTPDQVSRLRLVLSDTTAAA